MSTSTKVLNNTNISKNKYSPNGTKEDISLGILHSIDGFYVSNEGTTNKPNFHVWIPGITCSSCDSAYDDITLAVARCNYLAHTLTRKNALFNQIHYKQTNQLSFINSLFK